MSEKKQECPFKQGDKVELIPNSFNPDIENVDWANEDNEDLVPNYTYTVEDCYVGDWREQDPDSVYSFWTGENKIVGKNKKPVVMAIVSLVHTAVCGGSGYRIPAYRFKLAGKTIDSKRSPRKADGTIDKRYGKSKRKTAKKPTKKKATK